MKRKKGQTMIYKTLYRNLKIEQHAHAVSQFWCFGSVNFCLSTTTNCCSLGATASCL